MSASSWSAMSRIGRLAAAGQRSDDQRPDGCRKLGEKIALGHLLVKRGTSLPKIHLPLVTWPNHTATKVRCRRPMTTLFASSTTTLRQQQHQLHLDGRNTQQRPAQTKENKDDHINKKSITCSTLRRVNG